jgi:hypothetical protein
MRYPRTALYSERNDKGPITALNLSSPAGHSVKLQPKKGVNRPASMLSLKVNNTLFYEFEGIESEISR